MKFLPGHSRFGFRQCFGLLLDLFSSSTVSFFIFSSFKYVPFRFLFSHFPGFLSIILLVTFPIKSCFLPFTRGIVSFQVKNYLNYSKLAFPKPDPNEDSSGLNQESLFQITYYILGVIAFLVALGLGWDLWEYMNRKKTENTGRECGLYSLHFTVLNTIY